MKLARVAAAAGVFVLAGLLVWKLRTRTRRLRRRSPTGKPVQAPAFHLARLGRWSAG